LAGVSTAVVSYVINNGPRAASAEARARVLQAIDQLGYHPSALGRGLRAQRTSTIAYLDSDYSPLDVFVSSYSAGILTGLAGTLREHGYYLLIYPLEIGEDLTTLESMLRSGRVDGLVLRLVEDPPASDALLEVVSATGVPCICLERVPDARFGIGAITFDDTAAGYLATRYLLDKGHRRIAHLAGDERYASARDRRQGYLRALEEAGVEVQPELMARGDWDPLSVDARVEALRALPDPPTAVFSANDDLAFRLIQVLRDDGVRVPNDVAVVGFDDIPLADQMKPALTTLHIPLTDLGRRAAERLLTLVDTPEPPEPLVDTLPIELIPRASA
jgi:LacI family transcriptional regulator